MTTLIATVLIFLIMISLHEFGHFLFGKILGFNVLEYAIGFGPAIFKKQGQKTLYSFRIIPFGGFCKFAGEDGENTCGEGDFPVQPCWKRIIVLSAGAIFNILLGFILFVIFTVQSGSIVTNKIDSIIPDSYLAESGIQAGDEIININGKHIDFFRDIELAAQDFNKDSDILITVKRDEKKITRTIKLSEEIREIKYLDGGAEVTSYINGKEQSKTIQPYSETNPKQENGIRQIRYILGFIGTKESVNWFNVFPNSYYMTKYVVKLVCKTIIDMVCGNIGVEQLSGPIGIVAVVNETIEAKSYTMLNLLNLTALLTINLGIFNLLPLPALDGGRIVFTVIEMIRRKPIPPEKEGMVHSIGFLLLIVLMIFVLYQDILRIF